MDAAYGARGHGDGGPIVTTEVPGCRETVKEGVNGYLAPLRESEGLAEAMEKFIVNPELGGRIGAESLCLARENYDVRRVNESIRAAMGL